DLRRRQPYALALPHPGEHRLHHRAQVLVQTLDRIRDLAQDVIGVEDDLEFGKVGHPGLFRTRGAGLHRAVPRRAAYRSLTALACPPRIFAPQGDPWTSRNSSKRPRKPSAAGTS